MDNYNFKHYCCTEDGSSGSPILNIKNKVIGIHKESLPKKYNIGSFLYYSIKKYVDKYNLSKNYKIKDFAKIDLSEKYIGNDELILILWANELFDPNIPDTYVMEENK